MRRLSVVLGACALVPVAILGLLQLSATPSSATRVTSSPTSHTPAATPAVIDQTTTSTTATPAPPPVARTVRPAARVTTTTVAARPSTPIGPPADIMEPGLRIYDPGRGYPVLIYVHAYLETAAAPIFEPILKQIADSGFEVVVSDLGGPSTWGNQNATDAIAALKATYSPDRPVRLLATSMGGLALLNYASAHPGEVASAVGITPATNLVNICACLQDAIAQAVPAPPQPPATIGIRYQIWYGTQDDMVGVPTITGPRLELHPMPTGHLGRQPIDMAAIIAFLKA